MDENTIVGLAAQERERGSGTRGESVESSLAVLQTIYVLTTLVPATDKNPLTHPRKFLCCTSPYRYVLYSLSGKEYPTGQWNGEYCLDDVSGDLNNFHGWDTCFS